MAARVNSRFIIIMLVTVFTAAGAVGGLWYWQTKGDGERLVRHGDELFERGEFRRAMEAYGRAIRRQPGNVEWVRKMEQAILAQKPETADAARDLYERWLLALRLEAEFLPTDPDAQLRLIEELHDSARLVARYGGEAAQRNHWSQVETAADHMLLRVPEAEPRREYGRLYRAMAKFQHRRTLNEQELLQAEQDVAAFLEAMPNHDRGWAALVQGHLMLEEHARMSNDPRRIAEQRQRLAQIIEQAREASPSGAETSVVVAQYLTRAGIFPQGAPAPSSEDIDNAVEAMVAAVSRVTDAGDRAASWLVLEAMQVVLDRGGPSAGPVARRLIEQYLAQSDRAGAHRLALANLLLHQRDFAAAEHIVNDLLTQQQLDVSFLSRIVPAIQAAAAGLGTDIEYRRWTLDPADPDTVPAMVRAIARLERYLPDAKNDPRLTRAQGKLALMESRFAEAAGHFEKLIREGQGDVEVRLASAYVLKQLGDLGLALDRVNSVLATGMRPTPQLLMLKAELETALGRLEAAEDTARAYLDAIPPADADAAEQGSRLLRTINARKQGIAHDEEDPVQAALVRAQQAMDEGEAGRDRARASLLAALESHPDDVRLLGTLATLAMNAGQPDTAGQYLARALEIAPDHPALRQLAALAETGDPVDAAIEYFGEMEDEVERNAAVLRVMATLRGQSLIRAQSLRAKDSRTEEEEEQLQAALARADRAEALLIEASDRLRDIEPDHNVLIEYDFEMAIAQRDWQRAGQIVQRARRTNADLMNGLLYEGRLELERRPPRTEQAVRAFMAATELRPFSTTAWRGLAIAYQRVGNFREAVRAFEQAHAINPNDPQTIRGYLGLLIQVGDRTRAMRVARDAFRVMPGDVDLRELWLELEVEHNNVGVVIDRRYDIYRSNPGDRLNAMRLAVTLTRAEPRSDLLRDEQGKPLYTERQWNQMRVSDQRRAMEQQRRTWQSAAEQLLNELAARHAAEAGPDGLPDPDITSMRALLFRVRGDVGAGERVLREYIARVRGADVPATTQSRAMLLLASYQIESGLFSDAIETMRAAQQVQDPTVRDVDLAMADFLFGRGQYDQAKALYEDARRVVQSRAIDLRIIECAINLRQFEQAEAFMATLSPGPEATPGSSGAREQLEAGGDFMIEILRAMIARGRADDFAARGNTAEAQRQNERFEAALVNAERLSPSSIAPHLLRAQARIAEYRRTRQRTYVDQALVALDRADAIQAGEIQTSMARVEIHREAGNNRAATSELNRVLERAPGNVQARRILTQLHLDSGNIAAAIETVERAIELFPHVAAWHELHGTILASPESGRHASRTAAAAAYRKAFEITKSPALLSRTVSAYIAPNIGGPNDRVDPVTALQLMQAERELVEREPSLEAILAHLLVMTGREAEGRQRLGRSYRRYRAQLAEAGRSPADIGLWHQAASTAMAQMSSAEIEAMIKEAGENLPDCYDLLWLGRRESVRGRQSLPAAIELFRRAKNAPRADDAFRTGVLFEISSAQIALNEYSSAAEILSQVVETLPENWVARNNLAFVLAEHMDQAQTALTHARKALELMPGDASVLDTVGWVYFKLGDYTRAEEYLQQSLNVNESARTQIHLAEVMIATRRFDAALSRLRRAAELNPDAQTQADIDRLTDDIRTRRASA